MKTPQKKLNPLNIRMTDEMRSELAEIAAKENRTISNLVVTVLQGFLDARRKAAKP
jgi:uncharacterized protein (DUF1778 family)